MLTWTERILSVPVRTGAVREFLQELSLKGWGDLNGMLAILNDGELCREALSYWLEQEWITIAPNSPLTALAGPAYTRQLTLHRFCGEPPEDDWDEQGALIPSTGTLNSGDEDVASLPEAFVGEGEPFAEEDR